MVVFIEYVIIDNLVIDFLILKITFAILGLNFNKGRVLIASLFGTLIALIIPLVYASPLILFAIRFLCAFLMCAIANKHNSKRSYFIFTITFFTITFSLPKTQTFLQFNFSLTKLEYSNKVCSFISKSLP